MHVEITAAWALVTSAAFLGFCGGMATVLMITWPRLASFRSPWEMEQPVAVSELEVAA
jgi:hypothetical protein